MRIFLIFVGALVLFFYGFSLLADDDAGMAMPGAYHSQGAAAAQAAHESDSNSGGGSSPSDYSHTND